MGGGSKCSRRGGFVPGTVRRQPTASHPPRWGNKPLVVLNQSELKEQQRLAAREGWGCPRSIPTLDPCLAQCADTPAHTCAEPRAPPFLPSPSLEMPTKASTAPHTWPDPRTPSYRHPDPLGRHLLVGVGPFEVRVDGFREGGGDGQGVLCPHGQGAGSPR